jgi:formate dehydrogenase major subunit
VKGGEEIKDSNDRKRTKGGVVMEFSRRTFLKISGATTAGAILGGLGVNFLKPKDTYAQPLKIKYAKETTTICPYCGVGCGLIVSSKDGKVVNTEGDPDHPINMGSLCSKGAALSQIADNPRRLDKVHYRAPYSDKWEVKTWEWALNRIAKKIKDTRDKNWVTKDNEGYIVNRTEAIAALGGAALDNEECYAYSKIARALGIVYLEHQARI